MITTSLSPLGISWNVSIDNSPVDSRTVQRVSIDLKENHHDSAIIEVMGVPTVYLSEYVDKPIYVQLMISGNAAQEFYGYVKHIDASSTTHTGLVNNSPFQVVRIVCFGASYILRSKKNKIWQDVSLKDIVYEITNLKRFSFSIPNDSFRFKRLVQKQTSDWKFLVDISAQLGYKLSSHGSHLHIWDATKAIGRQISYTVLRNLISSKGDYRPIPGTIIYFEPVIGSSTPKSENVNNIVHFIDEQGVTSTIQNNDLDTASGFGKPLPIDSDDELAVNASSFEVAERIVQSIQKEKAFTYYCQATILSDPSIVPGGVVKVEGYGNNFDGFWYVNSVTHSLASESMLSTLSLSKSSADTTYDYFPIVAQYQKPPQTILINNAWVSQTEFSNVYN